MNSIQGTLFCKEYLSKHSLIFIKNVFSGGEIGPEGGLVSRESVFNWTHLWP